MENLSLIAAVGENGELGYNNSLIWRIREDLQFYKEMTMGKKIIMGRKTLESFPGGGALKGRTNIVMTCNCGFSKDGTLCVHDTKELLEELKKYKQKY